MNPEMMQFLRQVTASAGRTNATKGDRAGNLQRVIPLAATIVEVQNDHTVPIGVNIDGLVPNVYSSGDRYFWRLAPNTPAQMCEIKVFEPDNMFTKHM